MLNMTQPTNLSSFLYFLFVHKFEAFGMKSSLLRSVYSQRGISWRVIKCGYRTSVEKIGLKLMYFSELLA